MAVVNDNNRPTMLGRSTLDFTDRADVAWDRGRGKGALCSVQEQPKNEKRLIQHFRGVVYRLFAFGSSSP